MREKDELAERLIKANHDKLQTVVVGGVGGGLEGAVSGAKEEVPISGRLDGGSEAVEPQTAIFIWGVGMVHSSQAIDKGLQPRTPSGESLLEKKVYTSETIVRLDQTKDENFAL
jgi:hypothetical protein